MKYNILLILVFFTVSSLWLDSAFCSMTINTPLKIEGGNIKITPQEFSVLPPYLKARLLFQRHHNVNDPYYKKWQKKIGNDYKHFHHWASALIKEKRFYASATEADRNSYLNSAIRDYEYLIRHCNSNNRFMYYFYCKKGYLLLMRDDTENAIESFRKSISLKKDYFQAYQGLSEAYKKIGMPEKADEILRLGKKNRKKQ